MFEHHHQPLISRKSYYRRQKKYIFIAFSIICGSLLLGIFGYHLTEGMNYIDALLNSAMILGGMGPVDGLKTDAGKLFASFYALYSGVIFLVVAGLLFAPIYHRVLHHFHMEIDSSKQK
jgi:hypothetical protein